MTQAEDITSYLRDLKLPASKNEVKHAAKKGGAPKETVKMLDKLPWVTFQHLNDILGPLGLLAADEEKKGQVA
jgi:hypothetical protein